MCARAKGLACADVWPLLMDEDDVMHPCMCVYMYVCVCVCVCVCMHGLCSWIRMM